jgi:hypothetical protein
MFRILPALVAAAALVTASTGFAGEAAQLMNAKSAEEQRDILSLAVRSAQHQCAKISEHMYVGDKQGMDFFSVRCDDGTEYMVSIESIAEMQSRVILCKVLTALGVQCFKAL